MLFLSDIEKNTRADYARFIIRNSAKSVEYEKIRLNLRSAFNYYIGTHLAALVQNDRTHEWLYAGTMSEETGLFSSTFLLGILSRHERKMKTLPRLMKIPVLSFIFYKS